MKNANWALSVAGMALMFALPSGAATELIEEDVALAYGDDVTVSIATGSKQSLRRAPAVATVITAEDIADMGATDLDEVMRSVPGIHVSRSGSLYAPLYIIRGVYSQFNPQTLILRNGIPMTTMFVGNKGNVWAAYPVEHIARIEIIRGPGSALYGADAYAGVINIVTKTAEDALGTRVGVQAGSYSQRSAWINHGGKLGPFSVAAFVHAGKTDGFRRVVEADAQTLNDAQFGTDVSFAPGRTNVGNESLDANLDLSYGNWRARAGYKGRDNVGTGTGVNSALDPYGKMKSTRFNADVSWTNPQFLPNWGAGVTLSYLQYSQRLSSYLRLYPAGAVLANGAFPEGMIGAPQTWERQTRLSAFMTYTGFDAHRIRFGAGYEDLDLYRTEEYKNFTTPSGAPVPTGSINLYAGDQSFMAPQRRLVRYMYVQDEWQFAPDWALTAGVRHDNYSDFGSTTNPRLALVWDAAHNVTAKLLYGQAFRAPSFNEEFSINNPVVRGNITLKPETIRTLEAALSWQVRRDLRTNLNLFRYEMKDIIRTVPDPVRPGSGAYANTGGQDGTGLEFEAAWDVTRTFKLSGNYAYQRSIDQLSGRDAGYVPRHQAYLRAGWRFAEGWSLHPQFNWVGKRLRPATDMRAPLKGYTTVDLGVRYALPRVRNWSVRAAVHNLFDADVREPSQAPGLALPGDLPMAGRNFHVQLEYTM